MGKRIITEVFLYRWDNRIKIFKLPPGLELVLGEVDTGSNTPKMVSKVLEWRKNDPDSGNSFFKKFEIMGLNLIFVKANKIWNALSKLNGELELIFERLCLESLKDSDFYYHTLQRCSKMKAVEVSFL